MEIEETSEKRETRGIDAIIVNQLENESRKIIKVIVNSSSIV